MQPLQKRRLIWTGIRTALLTGAALMLQGSGALDRLESICYDLRTQHCQHFTPPPTRQLVHLDIDETALSHIGRWPWDRDKMAAILEEISLAEPKVIAMDVFFSEPARPQYDKNGTLTDTDAILAETIRKIDRVLLPASLTFGSQPVPGPLEQKLFDLLIANPELTLEQAIEQMKAAGLPPANLPEEVTQKFGNVRARAICERIRREIESGPADPAQIKQRLLPHFDPHRVASLDRLFDEEYARAICEHGMMRFTIPLPAGLPPILMGTGSIVPIAPLSAAARYGAFADCLPDGIDGRVRAVPMFAEYRGRLLPQMSLAIACAMLDIDPKNLQLSASSITLPRPGGQNIVIPVSTRATPDLGPAGMLMQLPVFGKRNKWATMYDFPRYEQPAQHVSVYDPWRILQANARIANNELHGDRLIFEAREKAGAEIPDAEAVATLHGSARRKVIEQAISELKAAIADPDLPKDIRDPMVKLRQPLITALTEVLKQNGLLEKQRDRLRADLHEKLHDKAVLFGGTATGLVDLWPTALHNACPGVVVHGTLLNGILTGRMWRVAPPSVTCALIAALGLLTGLFRATLRPQLALLAAAVMTAGYVFVNGYLLFDYGQFIVGLAGPVLATGIVWFGLTLTGRSFARL
jgi:CHASE2 domain-containing sensor protein